MTVADYSSARTGLLLVDPYNDFLSEGGKLNGPARQVIDSVNLLEHLRKLVASARAASPRAAVGFRELEARYALSAGGTQGAGVRRRHLGW